MIVLSFSDLIEWHRPQTAPLGSPTKPAGHSPTPVFRADSLTATGSSAAGLKKLDFHFNNFRRGVDLQLKFLRTRLRRLGRQAWETAT